MNNIFTIIFLFISYVLSSAISVAPPAFAEQEKTLIKVAYEPDLAPLNYLEDDSIKGFTIDLLKAIATTQDLDLLFIPLVKSEALKQIASGEVDIIASIPYSGKLTDITIYSEPFYSSSIGILTPKKDQHVESLSSLSNVLVALQSDTLEYDFLKNIRRIRYQVSHSQHTALKFFLAGRAEVYVGNIDTANFYLEKYNLHGQYQFSRSYLMPVDYSFGVQKNNYRLLSMLNSGLRQLKSSGVYSDIYIKWFDTQAEAISDLIRLIWKIAAGVAILFLVMMFVSIRWNRQLKRQVARKTIDLQHLNESLLQQIEITQNNNEFLKQVLDSSPRGIIILDKKGFITKSNKIAADVLGCHEVFKGKHYKEIQLINEILEDKIEPVLSGEKKHYLGEHKTINIDGKRAFQLRYNVYPLYQYDQKINGLILSIEDVTTELKVRKKMFEQEKNRALIRMVAGIAHEIRNPMSSIKTFVELIPRKIHNKKFQKEIATTVPREIERINRLIEGLISYAKPRNVTNDLVSTKKLVDECAILFSHNIRNKGFHLIKSDIEDHLIMTDHDQLKQIIINLIINAIDALEEKGQADKDKDLTIEINSKCIERKVCIQVIDNGIGMTTEEKSKAFDPFYTTKASGTGLGLPLVQQLLQESNGDVLIESKKNVGTTVSIYFELAEE